MEKYNDFALVSEDKVGEVNKAYKDAENKVEILRGENRQENSNNGGRFIGSPTETPTSEPDSSPINTPSNPITSPNLPQTSQSKKTNLTQFNLLLFVILLELLYDSSGTGCGGRF